MNNLEKNCIPEPIFDMDLDDCHIPAVPKSFDYQKDQNLLPNSAIYTALLKPAKRIECPVGLGERLFDYNFTLLKVDLRNDLDRNMHGTKVKY
jgi:hypothetical protein